MSAPKDSRARPFLGKRRQNKQETGKELVDPCTEEGADALGDIRVQCPMVIKKIRQSSIFSFFQLDRCV